MNKLIKSWTCRRRERKRVGEVRAEAISRNADTEFQLHFCEVKAYEERTTDVWIERLKYQPD